MSLSVESIQSLTEEFEKGLTERGYFGNEDIQQALDVRFGELVGDFRAALQSVDNRWIEALILNRRAVKSIAGTLATNVAQQIRVANQQASQSP